MVVVERRGGGGRIFWYRLGYTLGLIREVSLPMIPLVGEVSLY